jgi:hypothetical protein
VVATCAAAALFAPAAGASTVTAEHVDGTPPAGVAYVDDSTTGTSLGLKFVGSELVFGDPAAEPFVYAQSDPADPTAQQLVNDCLPGTDVGTVACPPIPANIKLGTGNDTLTLGAGLPPLTIDGRAGTDRLDFTGRQDAVTVDLGAGTPELSVTGVENVTGGDKGDHIDGDAAGNRLSGGAGDDIITGGPGVNMLRGGAGDDQLTAGEDGDSLVGGDGVDAIKGGAGDDAITAADGVADQITCGAGNDTVSADPTDTFAPAPDNCEEVTIAGATAPDPVPTPTPDPLVTTTETSVIFVPALGSIVPVLAPGPANIADLIPPGASMRSAIRQRVATVLSRGVPVRVTCKESCGISVALSVDRATARRLKLDARSTPVVIGTASATRTIAGTTHLRVKFTKRARTALKRSTRSVATTTQVLVSDASGNGTLLSRHVTLVR